MGVGVGNGVAVGTGVALGAGVGVAAAVPDGSVVGGSVVGGAAVGATLVGRTAVPEAGAAVGVGAEPLHATAVTDQMAINNQVVKRFKVLPP